MAVLAYLFVRNRFILLLFVFEVADFTKMLVQHTIPALPIDFVFIFGVTASYYYGFNIAMIIFVLGIVNRIVMSCVEARHITKAVRHFSIFLLVSFLSSFPYFTVAISMLILNYILKYGFSFFTGNPDIFEKSVFHISNIIGSTMMFYLIYMIYFYFPFLI